MNIIDFRYKTKKIDFSMHYKHRLISIDKLKEYMVSDEEKNLACTHGLTCSNHKNCWSCPPLAPSFDKYNRDPSNKPYTKCLVYAFWIDWDFSINSDNPYFRLINANRTVSPYTFNYGKILESAFGGKDMIDGRCPLCIKCKKVLGEPCAFPKERRSSLEALGIDATRLSECVLEHEIQWYKKIEKDIIIPKYITAIHGFLCNLEREPNGIVKPNRSLFE